MEQEYEVYGNEFMDGDGIDNRIMILNDLFKFRKEHMPEYSILDTIIEYANKKGYNYEFLAQELSEIKGFVDIVENDCNKYKYSINTNKESIGNDWE